MEGKAERKERGEGQVTCVAIGYSTATLFCRAKVK